jgi:asparagine synthase (glutamine-hydrolysing)
MCGVLGLFSPRSQDWPIDQLRTVAKSLESRGPDARGEYVDGHAVALHFRLAITDPHERSNQPFFSPDRNLFLSFNGQIYNHLEIRHRLTKEFSVEFQTDSDTETLLVAYQQWGAYAFSQMDGDFAGFIYNIKTRTVLLFRDPVGTKPLYYSFLDEKFIVSSLLQPIVKYLGRSQINSKALGNHLALRYCLGEDTIFSDIYRLAPSSIAVLKVDTMDFTQERYSPHGVPSPGDVRSTMLDNFKNRTATIKQSLFLSAGIDSSAIGFYGTRNSQIEALTFQADQLDPEPDLAAQFCASLAIPHSLVPNELESQEAALAALNECVRAMEEPIGDSICLLQNQLFKRARESSKVALSGEGADEIFAGYAHHRALWISQKMPSFLFKAMPGPVAFSLMKRINPYPIAIDEKTFHRIYASLKNRDAPSFLTSLVPVIDNETIQRLCPSADVEGTDVYFSKIDSLETLLDMEWKNWLPNYNLNRVDKLSMSHGLEVRVPFASWKLRNRVLRTREAPMSIFSQKNILRKALKQDLPSSVVRMKKRPFTVTSKSNMALRLKELACRVLSEERTQARNFWNRDLLLELIKDDGTIFYQKRIFNLLVIELWLREFID